MQNNIFSADFTKEDHSVGMGLTFGNNEIICTFMPWQSRAGGAGEILFSGKSRDMNL